MRKIAVIGGTGMLGQPVVRELIRTGYQLTLLVRDPEKAQAVFGNEVRYQPGDISNEQDIRTLLQNQEGVYLNLSVRPGTSLTDFQPEREGLQTTLKVAKETGIKRVGYLSSLVQFYQGTDGFRWWVFDIKQAANAAIKASGIPYTIFYPSSFMENFDKGGYKSGNKLNLAGTSKHKMYFIAGCDYGQQVAAAFQNNTADNKEYAVQGLEGYTGDEAAEIFRQHYTPEKLKIVRVPLGLLHFLGIFSKKMSSAAHIINALNNYPEKFAAENTWKELGKPTVTLPQYTQRLSG